MLPQEFTSIIEDLLEEDEILRLGNLTQHSKTTRLKHCTGVAYSTYVICKRLKLDYIGATRAAFLHDFYSYKRRTGKRPEGYHIFAHPKIALENARRLTALSHMQEDAILNHMWPLSRHRPKYWESMIVCFVDKYCAIREVYHGFVREGV